MMNADGSGQQVLSHDAWTLGLAWSPDGRKIAFSSAQAGPENIYVLNADGSDQRQLTHSHA